MTDMTDDQVRALLDGATPGPWRADGEPWNRIVWSSADNRVCFMAHSSGLNDARDIATSNLVAAAPDLARTVIALHAQLADAEATQAALRAEIDRLTRWRAEEGEKIKRQAKALTDLTKHCQRIEAENAGLARKIGKVQRGDGDHSQIADLEAKVINQRNELANLRARDGRLAELAADRYRLAAANAALEAKVAGLVEAMEEDPEGWPELAVPNRNQQFIDGAHWGIRKCIAWLHARAGEMRDPDGKARDILNATATNIGMWKGWHLRNRKDRAALATQEAGTC